MTKDALMARILASPALQEIFSGDWLEQDAEAHFSDAYLNRILTLDQVKLEKVLDDIDAAAKGVEAVRNTRDHSQGEMDVAVEQQRVAVNAFYELRDRVATAA